MIFLLGLMGFKSKLYSNSYEDISSGYSSPDASIRSGPPVFPEQRLRSRIPKVSQFLFEILIFSIQTFNLKDEIDEDLNLGRESDPYLRNAPKIPKNFQRIEEIREISTTPTNENLKKGMNDEEIIKAYEKLQKKKSQVKIEENGLKDKYEQFMEWMELNKKQEQEKETEKDSDNSKDKPKVIPILEEKNITELVNVAKVEHESSEPEPKIESTENFEDFDEFKDTISVSSEENFSETMSLTTEEYTVIENVKIPLVIPEEVKIVEVKEDLKEVILETDPKQDVIMETPVLQISEEPETPKQEIVRDPTPPSDVKAEQLVESMDISAPQTAINGKPELDTQTELEEKPKVSSSVPKRAAPPPPVSPSVPKRSTSLFKPLTVVSKKLNDLPSESKLEKEEEIIKSIKGSLENIEKIMVEAKLTLSDNPLEVSSSVTNIKGSTSSLSSSRSREKSIESNQKRQSSHSKGPAPKPPSKTPPREEKPSTTGQYFDKLTKRFFKETEL